MSRKFTVRNESFECQNCSSVVNPLKIGCRNHCPHCLFSRHLDHSPGDRLNTCQGLMEPYQIEIRSSFKIIIVHKCLKCNEKSLNKAALDDPMSDNYDLILELSHKKNTSDFQF